MGAGPLGHCPKPNNYECELLESEYLPSISFKKFRVGGWWWWCTEIIASALLLFLSKFESQIGDIDFKGVFLSFDTDQTGQEREQEPSLTI